jgi:hypothetical protein
MVEAGVAVVDITPPAGLMMSGFAARTEPATGAHDALTARALAIDDTAIVVADVLGFSGEMSRRIRARCGLPDERVIVTAVHNHGGPASMAGRAGQGTDPGYLRRLEDACVAAIDRAVAARRPAELTAGLGPDPGVARNRRHPGGIVDPAVPVLRVRGADGRMIAIVTSHACHPVVLGADNRLWTADYVHYVRAGIEAATPGAVALFLTGCAGDANTGHSAQASVSLVAHAERSFATAERLGSRIAAAALAAPATPAGTGVSACSAEVHLNFERLEREPLPALARRWRAEQETAGPARAALLGHWIDWAEGAPPPPFAPLAERVSLLHWGKVPIVALPGEIFAETGLSIRDRLGRDRPAFVLAYAEDVPGYIPPASEFPHGGYEVEEAHRFIGMPATFARGSAEALRDAALGLATETGVARA